MGLAFVQPMSLLQGIAELSSDPQLTVLMLRLHYAVIEGEVRGSGSEVRGSGSSESRRESKRTPAYRLPLVDRRRLGTVRATAAARGSGRAWQAVGTNEARRHDTSPRTMRLPWLTAGGVRQRHRMEWNSIVCFRARVSSHCMQHESRNTATLPYLWCLQSQRSGIIQQR